MTTARTIITQAMQEIRALSPGEDPTAEEAADGLFRLQKVVDALLGAGTTLTLDTVMPNADDEAFVLELALRLAPTFGAQISPETMVARQRARNRLKASLATPVVTPADDAVQFLSRQVGRWGWLGF